MSSLPGRYAIAGFGEIAPEPNEDFGGYYGLNVEVAARAIEDAGLTRKDIDGVVFSMALGPPFPHPAPYCAHFCQYMGLLPAWFESVPYGGVPTGALYVARAAMGIAAGLATTVLVVSADNFRTRLRGSGAIAAMASTALDAQYESPYGGLNMATWSMMTQRHMHEFGTTHEQLAEVAVASREWASLNPAAERRTPIDIQGVMDSRMISSPVTIEEMALISDGGGAVIVTTLERARDLPKPPVEIVSFSEIGMSMTFSEIASQTDMYSIRLSTERALANAGMTLADMDAVYPYDPATIATIVSLEQMGFCGIGEGGAFIEDGKLRPGGSLPCSTHGGLMQCRHPGIPGGFFQVTEAVRQLRGECGERQVPNMQTALLQSEGGYIAHSTTVLSTATV
jgi:acetyl-CoA acetyltransferase